MVVRRKARSTAALNNDGELQTRAIPCWNCLSRTKRVHGQRQPALRIVKQGPLARRSEPYGNSASFMASEERAPTVPRRAFRESGLPLKSAE